MATLRAPMLGSKMIQAVDGVDGGGGTAQQNWYSTEPENNGGKLSYPICSMYSGLSGL